MRDVMIHWLGEVRLNQEEGIRCVYYYNSICINSMSQLFSLDGSYESIFCSAQDWQSKAKQLKHQKGRSWPTIHAGKWRTYRSTQETRAEAFAFATRSRIRFASASTMFSISLSHHHQSFCTENSHQLRERERERAWFLMIHCFRALGTPSFPLCIMEGSARASMRRGEKVQGGSSSHTACHAMALRLHVADKVGLCHSFTPSPKAINNGSSKSSQDRICALQHDERKYHEKACNQWTVVWVSQDTPHLIYSKPTFSFLGVCYL